MSLAQQLLLRALVARFWREPYAPARLARWGTRAARPLHAAALRRAGLRRRDRRLTRAGFALRAEWFAPHFEFRFPKLGDRGAAASCNSSCARRSSPGTSWARRAPRAARCAMSTPRSSACRSRCAGWRPTATSSTCNGRARAAASDRHATANSSRACAIAPGSRRSALHPNIGIHAPLTFDIVDTWMQRSEAVVDIM